MMRVAKNVLARLLSDSDILSACCKLIHRCTCGGTTCKAVIQTNVNRQLGCQTEIVQDADGIFCPLLVAVQF